MKGWVVLLALFLALAAMPMARADIVNFVPSGDDIQVNQSITLANGFYTIVDTNSNGVFIIKTSNIVLDCNGSVINGTGYVAILNNGFNNVTTKNCQIYNSLVGIEYNGSSSGLVYNNTFLNNSGSIVLYNSSGTQVFGNKLSSALPLIGPMMINTALSTGLNISYNSISCDLNSPFASAISDSFSSANRIEGNLISCYLNGITSLLSSGSYFVNNTVTLSNSSGWGINIQNQQTVTVIANNLNTGIYLKNDTISGFSGNNYKTKLVSQVVDISVNGQGGNPIFSAGVLVSNISAGSYSIAKSTLIDGHTGAFEIFQSIENYTGANYSYYPLQLNVSLAGYVTNSTLISPTQQTTYTIVLSPVATPPSGNASVAILSYNTSSSFVALGSTVSLAMYANNSASVWINLSYPNASVTRLNPANGGYVNFTPPVAGVYGATFFANDTSGNRTNASLSFTAAATVPVNITITGKNNGNLTSNVTFIYSGTANQAAFFSSSTGNYDSQTLFNVTYDMDIKAYNGSFEVKLLGIDFSSNANRIITIDKSNVLGFVVVYAIENGYNITGARINISYRNLSVANEASLGLWKCANWSIVNSTCSGVWTPVSSTVDNTSDVIWADVAGFSAYGIKQGSYCGNGVCDTNEGPTNCSADCACISGQARLCGVNHFGICAVGTETCTNGAWLGCPAPINEICNQIDDNCDQIIDNVGGGNSTEETRCQCYNGASPTTESCDNVDNNCNGQIDEGITRSCGSNIGICREGVTTCIAGYWSADCVGEVRSATELCANNLDDNCDGQIDEVCNQTCQIGAIPDSGCKCGNMSYVSGYCCSGNIFNENSCFRLPWELLLAGGITAAIAGVVIHKMKGKKKKSSSEWDELEKKYSEQPQ